MKNSPSSDTSVFSPPSLQATVIHWGWVTPGVPDCNRKLQETMYLGFLKAKEGSGACYNFTQPGWVLDEALPASLVDITAKNPEKGWQGRPFQRKTLTRLREYVSMGLLKYAAYPYSGGVVEGMTGESVLRTLRLTREVVEKNLGVSPTTFFIHDLGQLDWNVPVMVQVGRLTGFENMAGAEAATLIAVDGSQMKMFGQPAAETNPPLVYDIVELMDGPHRVVELEKIHGATGIQFIPLDSLPEKIFSKKVACREVHTKGWYGGAPLVMLMQAALRRTDRRLTALATLDALFGRKRNRTDFWKKSLILQDCHLQWLLHDLQLHYLPETKRFERQVARQLEGYLQPKGKAAHFFNPLPFSRAAVIKSGAVYRFHPKVPAFATASQKEFVAKSVQVSATCLQNDRIRIELGPRGEITGVSTARGAKKRLSAGTANLVRHWHNRSCFDEVPFVLKTGEIWGESKFSGNLLLTTEVDAPVAGEYAFDLDIPIGMGTIFGVEGGDWSAATNKHWAGGLPSANRDREHSGKGKLTLAQGKNRLYLHAVADDGFHLASATLTYAGQTLSPTQWEGRCLDCWEIDPFTVERVKVLEEGARGTVIFEGAFQTCAAKLELSLDYGSERIDVRFVRHYAQPVHEGFFNAPLPPEIGSYLGSYCERPYVPAYTVESETVWNATRYLSDKPFGYAEAKNTERGWRVGRFRMHYDGATPFLGIDTAIAETKRGSTLLLTDGHNHFFRRRDPDGKRETLGLSLGSSVIHPQTQGYKMKPDSPWEKIGRHMITDYDNAHDTSAFVPPQGEVVSSWSYLFSNQPAMDRASCHRERLARLLPVLASPKKYDIGLSLSGKGVAWTAVEKTAKGLRLRVTNLGDKEQPIQIGSPRAITGAVVTAGMELRRLKVKGRMLSAALPPLALREIELLF